MKCLLNTKILQYCQNIKIYKTTGNKFLFYDIIFKYVNNSQDRKGNDSSYVNSMILKSFIKFLFKICDHLSKQEIAYDYNKEFFLTYDKSSSVESYRKPLIELLEKSKHEKEIADRLYILLCKVRKMPTSSTS